MCIRDRSYTNSKYPTPIPTYTNCKLVPKNVCAVKPKGIGKTVTTSSKQRSYTARGDTTYSTLSSGVLSYYRPGQEYCASLNFYLNIERTLTLSARVMYTCRKAAAQNRQQKLLLLPLHLLPVPPYRLLKINK